jgi:hypothetical protein
MSQEDGWTPHENGFLSHEKKNRLLNGVTKHESGLE